VTFQLAKGRLKPVDPSRGPPTGESRGRAARTTAPSPWYGMADRIEDVSGVAVDWMDLTWLQQTARHNQTRTPDRTRVGQPTHGEDTSSLTQYSPAHHIYKAELGLLFSLSQPHSHIRTACKRPVVSTKHSNVRNTNNTTLCWT
jgi:hypothetical protein